MNLHANDRNTNKTHRKWIRGRRKRGNWTILDISPLSSSFFLHPPPFLLTRIMFHFRCGLSPLFWLFSGLVFCPSLFPCVSSCGVSVAGPHPSQTTALMVPCSVPPSALQFCHSEHQICGGWSQSPPPH